VLTYKGTDKQLPQIAEELKVNYILEGTYKKMGDKVRVTAQLIEPKNDKHIWLNTYDRPYEEIITIQSDIALQIADHLKVFLTSSEKQNIQKIPTTNQEAYELLQQVWYLLITYGSNALDQGLDLCLQAIELDPDYADAYAWAGTGILLKGSYAGGSEIQSVVWEAQEYFEKALELDQNNGRAHIGLALINEWIRWDYIRAEKEYLKAIELLPNNLENVFGYIEFLVKMNKLEDALFFQEKIKYEGHTIQIQILSGNIKEARNSIKTFLESSIGQGNRWVGEYYIWLEEYDSAKLYLESAMQSKEPEILIPRFQAYLALAYHKTNHYQEARTIINQLIEMSDTTSAGSPDFFTGWYYSGIGEVDSAFYWLEKAYKNRSPEMPWLKVDPVFKNIKNDNRYRDLYERTGHKAYDEYMASLKQ
jgi:tetratricopeptide (TPR) repeat protein